MNALKFFLGVKLSLLLTLLTSQTASAGFTELSATANYRKSSIDENNYQESVSYVGSIAYYFWELSALELSYTNGQSTISVQPIGDIKTLTTTDFELTGLDLVFTLAARDDLLQPYIKIGGAYLKKRIVEQPDGLAAQVVASQDGLAPSAGVGIKIQVAKDFFIKAGVDAWSSPLKVTPIIVDYAARAGVSWLL